MPSTPSTPSTQSVPSLPSVPSTPSVPCAEYSEHSSSPSSKRVVCVHGVSDTLKLSRPQKTMVAWVGRHWGGPSASETY